MAKEYTIVQAAVVQRVWYPSRDVMYRVNARKSNNGQLLRYISISDSVGGGVEAMIQFGYNGKPLLGESGEAALSSLVFPSDGGAADAQ